MPTSFCALNFQTRAPHIPSVPPLTPLPISSLLGNRPSLSPFQPWPCCVDTHPDMEPELSASKQDKPTDAINIRRMVPHVLALVAFLLAAWSLSQAWASANTRLTNTGCEEEALF